MLKEICQLQLADLTNHDSLNHESIQIRISRHTIAKPANHELNHQDWRFVQALFESLKHSSFRFRGSEYIQGT